MELGSATVVNDLVRTLAIFMAQTAEVRWVAPPPGSMRRGLWWTHSPRLVVAIALIAVVLTVALALYRRLKQRRSG